MCRFPTPVNCRDTARAVSWLWVILIPMLLELPITNNSKLLPRQLGIPSNHKMSAADASELVLADS